MMFVGDYEKILRVLLSHPKIRHVEYVPEWRVIQAIFDDPYLPRGEQDVIVRETLELEARDREEGREMKAICEKCGRSWTVPSDIVAWDCPECGYRNKLRKAEKGVEEVTQV